MSRRTGNVGILYRLDHVGFFDVPFDDAFLRMQGKNYFHDHFLL